LYGNTPLCHFLVTLGLVPFFAAITFFTIGIAIGANFTATLTTLDTFTNNSSLDYLFKVMLR